MIYGNVERHVMWNVFIRQIGSIFDIWSWFLLLICYCFFFADNSSLIMANSSQRLFFVNGSGFPKLMGIRGIKKVGGGLRGVCGGFILLSCMLL